MLLQGPVLQEVMNINENKINNSVDLIGFFIVSSICFLLTSLSITCPDLSRETLKQSYLLNIL